MAGKDEVLQVVQEGAIVHLMFNRPEKRNALNDALIDALDVFFSDVPETAKVIIVSGAGGHFSSGLDLGEQVHREPLGVMAHSRNWHRVMNLMRNCGRPIVAAMDGAVMGGGLEFASTCHVRVAEETVQFRMPEGLRGIFVGGGGSVRISNLIGADRMTEMMLTGRVYTGTEGVNIGLAHYAVPQGTALEKARELAERIATNSGTINQFIINGLSQIATMPPEAGLYAESLSAALSQTGPDAEEGLKAFLEKRAPVFR